ncbi:MAG: DNA translocase FtsK 4TM domain-containing protein [Patescibacteria group bacterium]
MPFSSKSKQRAYQREYQRKRRREKTKEGEYEGESISPAIKMSIAIIILLVAATLSVLAFFDLAGPFGVQGKLVLERLFGWGAYAFPAVLVIISLLLLKEIQYQLNRWQVVGVILFFGAALGILHHAAGSADAGALDARGGGGYIGFALQYPFSRIAGYWGAWVFLAGAGAIGIMLSLSSFLFGARDEENAEEPAVDESQPELESVEPKSLWGRMLERMRVWKLSREYGSGDAAAEEHPPLAEEPPVVAQEPGMEPGQQEMFLDGEPPSEAQAVVTKRARKRVTIPIDLLEPSTEKPSATDVDATRDKIQKTLATFGINVEMDDVNVGPTVTQYTLRPPVGVKLSRLTGLANELSLALAAHPLRMEAPIPGKSLVGIEIPNAATAKVKLKDIMTSDAFKRRTSNLTISLGKDVSGRAHVADLARMPHLLIAGSTGSGKSVAINTIIVSLMYQNSPDDLKLILVDPKKVELTTYNDIPYLLTPVITEVKKTVNALKWVVGEMERRYVLLSNRGKRNIDAYNAANKGDTIPHIVFIIDELADLMAVAANEVEAAIVRLAQMARAVGIHLVLATQRPSVNVITGLIKANIPSRIAFAVPSQIDSRTILDTSGAEKLLGRGDMLFTASDANKPRRLQGAFLEDAEIERVVNFLKEEEGGAEYHDEIVEKQRGATMLGGGYPEPGGDEDNLYHEAREQVVRAGKASASLLQRRLRIGYARAARLLDLLEEEGIIGPADGARPREILISSGGEASGFTEEEVPEVSGEEEPADRY